MNPMIRLLRLSAMALILMGIGAAVPVVAQNSNTQTLQFDDTIYKVPAGWRAGKTKDEYAQIYSTESPVPTIRIYRSQSVPSSIQRWMKKEAEQTFDEEDRIDVKEMASRSLVHNGLKYHLVGLKSGREHRVVMAVVGKSKASLLMLDLRLPRSKTKADEILVGEKSLTRLFSRFCVEATFVSQGAKPLLGKPVAGELSGAWVGLAYTYNVDSSVNFQNRFYLFSESGRFFKGLPDGDSVANFDFEKAIQRFPHRAGNYRVRDGKVLLELANGLEDQLQLRSAENKSPRALSRATIPKNGTKLNGVYRDLHYSGFTPGAGVEGGIAAQKTYTFTASGSFQATQFRGSFGRFQGGGFSAGRVYPDVKGTYRVVDGTLVLTDERGEKSVCSLVQLGDKLLFINGDQYLKSLDD